MAVPLPIPTVGCLGCLQFFTLMNQAGMSPLKLNRLDYACLFPPDTFHKHGIVGQKAYIL